MKLEGDYLFEATVPEVWSALFDPVILAAVMPGCEKLELVDGHYVGEIKVKVGPIQGKFTGKVDLKDKVEPESYTMIVDGRGAPGFVKATAAVKLAAEGTGTRETVAVLEDVASIVEVRVYVREPEHERWRLLTLGEQRALWGFRGASTRRPAPAR